MTVLRLLLGGQDGYEFVPSRALVTGVLFGLVSKGEVSLRPSGTSTVFGWQEERSSSASEPALVCCEEQNDTGVLLSESEQPVRNHAVHKDLLSSPPISPSLSHLSPSLSPPCLLSPFSSLISPLPLSPYSLPSPLSPPPPLFFLCLFPLSLSPLSPILLSDNHRTPWWTNKFYWGYSQEYGWGLTLFDCVASR